MLITEFDIQIHRRTPNPNPIRDALQALPGAGSVEVTLTAAEAIRRSRAFKALGCAWWEEPIPADDIDGYASHGGGPVQLNVMACLPNAMYLETGLIAEGSKLKLTDGYVDIPDGPGFSWA